MVYELCKLHNYFMNHLKLVKTTLNIYFLFAKILIFFREYREYKRMENPNYKSENIERKNLKIMQKDQFLKAKVKKSLLELEKYFYRIER